MVMRGSPNVPFLSCVARACGLPFVPPSQVLCDTAGTSVAWKVTQLDSVIRGWWRYQSPVAHCPDPPGSGEPVGAWGRGAG